MPKSQAQFLQYIQGYISGCMQGARGSVRSVQGAGCRGRLWRRVRDGCLSAVSGRELWRRVRKIPAAPFQDYRTIWTTFIGLSERLAAGVSARAADCAGRLPGAAGLCARGNSWQRGNKWIRLFFIPISNILLRG